MAFSEIEAFPSRVLAHHYPNVPNLGDMTKFKEWPDATVDLLVGGTPCQSFSVAGLRKGLDDPRGNLMLTFGAIAARYRPQWLVWENVPGVLSSGGGRDFGSFLGMLGELGYGFAYRVLDAQYFGVAQRRRRVFVVGCLGDWRRAAAVLFERASLSRNPAPRREAGQRVANALTDRADRGGRNSEGQRLIPQVSPALKARDYKGPSSDGDGDGAPLIPCVTHSLRGEGFDASEDGTGRGTPLVPVAFHNRQDPDISGDITHPLGAKDNGMAVAFICKDYGADAGDIAPTLRSMGHDGSHANGGGQVAVQQAMQVRRLTGLECSRLQGFPDDYLELTYADADEAHAAQVLHELWRQAGAPPVEGEGQGTGIVASLLTPEILLAGVFCGWLSWAQAERYGERAWLPLPGGDYVRSIPFLRGLRAARESGCSPYQRESCRQLAAELGIPLPILPLEAAQAREVLRSSELWPQAQRAWPLRYAFAKGQKTGGGPPTPDGPRYRALGNSMAVPVMAWIGGRIQSVEDISAQREAVA